MDIRNILTDLRAERTRIDKAIAALEELNVDGRRTGSPTARITKLRLVPKKRNGRRRISAAGRKRLSDLMKARWAAKRKNAKSA